MKVLVTGGGGFIGSHIAEYYAHKGAEVTVIDNLSRRRLLHASVMGYPPTYNWDFLRKFKNIRLLKADVRNGVAVKEAARNAEAIFHTAGQVAVTSSVTNPVVDFKVNALGSFNVLEAARLNDATVVFCSTNKVYGGNVNLIPVTATGLRYEFSDPHYSNGIPESFSVDASPHSPYGCSKLSADLYVQEYGFTYGLKTGVFRMSCIYGERQFGIEDQGWLAWFVRAVLTKSRLTIYGDGKQVRDVLHVEDLVRAFDLFLKRKIGHEVFNIGGGRANTVSLLELLALLEALTGLTPRYDYSDWRPADQKVYISDISKAFNLLGWRPRIDPKRGVERVLKWTREVRPSALRRNME